MITLFLMTYKGYSVLRTLINQNKQGLISKVIIGEDKKVARDYSSEIIGLCEKNNIDHEKRNKRSKAESCYSIAVSWKWIIKDKNTKLIVIHDSLLPKYRGFAPLVASLKNGEKEAGVTAIFAEDSYDKGDIIHQLRTEISYPKKIGTLIEEISELYEEMVLYLFEEIEKGSELPSRKQKEEQTSYSLWLDEDDYLIDWTRSSEEIVRFINAVGEPYRGASAFIKQKKVRILSAETFPDLSVENRTPGKIIFKDQEYPVVVCRSGLIKLKDVRDNDYKSVLPIHELRIRLSNGTGAE